MFLGSQFALYSISQWNWAQVVDTGDGCWEKEKKHKPAAVFDKSSWWFAKALQKLAVA